MKTFLIFLSVMILLTGCQMILREGEKAVDDLDGSNDVPDSIFHPDLNYDPATQENPLPLFRGEW